MWTPSLYGLGYVMCMSGVVTMESAGKILRRKEGWRMRELGDGIVTQYYEDGREDSELDMECSTLAVDELLAQAEELLSKAPDTALLLTVYRKGRRDRLREAMEGLVT